MRYILLCCSLFVFFDSQAQQINPVPDYVFQNRMSVGRTAVTDTAAYFSIGPRYGAIRGFMPPMVIDTANVSGNKRNGLLIFSIQKNKYVYWDSVGAKWAEMAGTAGTALTSADTANLLSTRAWRKKGDDSLGALIALKVNISDTSSMLSTYTRGSGTTNYVPKFTGTRTLGNSQIFDDGNRVGINTASPTYKLHVSHNDQLVGLFAGAGSSTDQNNGGVTLGIRNTNVTNGNQEALSFQNSAGVAVAAILAYNTNHSTGEGFITFGTRNSSGTFAERIRITADGELLIGTTTDAGDYKLQVAGSIYNTTGAVLAATSGDVGVGTTSPNQSGAAKALSINNANNVVLELNINNVRNAFFYTDGAQAILASSTAIPLTFRTGNTERMRITSDGELLIATTTDAGDYKLQVAGSIYSSSGQILAMGDGASPTIAFANETDLGFARIVGNLISVMNGGVQLVQIGDAGLRVTTGQLWNDQSGTAALPSIAMTGAKNSGLYMPTSGIIGFSIAGSEYMRLNNSGELIVGSTSDAGAYAVQVTGAIYTTTTFTTGAPTSGSAKPWRLGEAATVSPTSPNRTIRVEIDGTVYYIHAKTTND